jgi:hypothetical protein
MSTKADQAHLAFHDVRVERDTALEQLKPKLEIRDNDPACIHDERSRDDRFQLRRLVVGNDSGSSVDGIKMSIIGVRYRGNPDDIGHHHPIVPMLPLPLAPQHMRDATAESVFSLAPGDKRLVDVVSLGLKRHAGYYEIWHTVPRVHALIPAFEDDSYLLDIQVVGSNVPPTTKTARLRQNDDGRLSLALVP